MKIKNAPLSEEQSVQQDLQAEEKPKNNKRIQYTSWNTVRRLPLLPE